jgi:hypothetical protein
VLNIFYLNQPVSYFFNLINMSNYLLSDHPLTIILLLPIIISVNVTSKLNTKIVGFSCLLLFSLLNIISLNKTYPELWAIIIYVLIHSALLLMKWNKQKEYTKLGKTLPEEYAYIRNRDFAILSNDEFDELFNNCRKVKTKNKEKILTNSSQRFDKVYYFAYVPKNALITIRYQNTIISYIKEGSWVGIVEFINFFYEKSSVNWIIDVELKNNDQEIIWYEWDMKVILVII